MFLILFNKFVVANFGLYNKLRDHDFLWDTIKNISIEEPNFQSDLKLFFAGEIHDNFINVGAGILDVNFSKSPIFFLIEYAIIPNLPKIA